MEIKTIAIIGTRSEFRAFNTFCNPHSSNLKFIQIEYPHQLQGIELIGYINTGTLRPDIADQITEIANKRIR